MTPEKPDIDLKLDGVKREFIYLGRDVVEPIRRRINRLG